LDAEAARGISGKISGPSALSTHPSSAECIVSGIKRHKITSTVIVGRLVLGVVGIVIWINRYSRGTSPKKVGVSFQSAKFTRLTSTGKVTDAAISPNGKYVAHVVDDGGQQSLWMRQTNTQSNVQIVPPADVLYHGMVFTPDGDYVYYTSAEENEYLGNALQSADARRRGAKTARRHH